MSIIKLPLCYKCGVPHVPDDVASRVRSGENITIEIISHNGVAGNILRWGTGGLNIDQCRVQASERPLLVRDVKDEVIQNAYGDGLNGSRAIGTTTQGRFPSNLLLSHSWLCTDELCDEQCPIRLLDEQSGSRSSHHNGTIKIRDFKGWQKSGSLHSENVPVDQGGASRYFTQFSPQDEVPIPFLYQSKASRAERNRGCEGLPEGYNDWQRETSGLNQDRPNREGRKPMGPQSNHHPTVKPIALMSWLCRLITPPNGIVLDCFAGSGSTLVACVHEGLHFIGIEAEADYCAIARARLAYVMSSGVISDY